MMRTALSIPNAKPRFLNWVENGLLFFVLGLTALRATFIESPQANQQEAFFLTSQTVSLLLSTLLLGCFAVWVFASLVLNQFRWRKTWLLGAFGLFLAAGVISFFAASDKRMAVTDWVVLASPMMAAMLLIQLLRSQHQCRLAVLVVIAVAAAATVLCFDQMAISNEEMIADYELNTDAHLGRLGIEADSLRHWMYEHRLYSKDIRGFLMTSNSAASFFLMSVFAGLGLCVEAFRRRAHVETMAALVCYVLLTILVTAGLAVTQSKGGLGAFAMGLLLFAVLSLFGKRLWKYRRAAGIVLLIGIAVGAAVIVGYGCQHGRLPGGNSMLVRWQYWQSTSEMIGDHALTGVGGGNFSEYYPHYKAAAASETVQNPHNWVLSLLSQYGPLGLAAFCLAAGAVFFKSLQGRFAGDDIETQAAPEADDAKKQRMIRWLLMLGVMGGLMLFVRPVLVGSVAGARTWQENAAGYIWLFLMPAGAFMIPFVLLCLTAEGDVSIEQRNDSLTVAMVCGLAAVLIHNLIDFAIFEPGNWGTFWLFAAILVAMVHNRSEKQEAAVTMGAGSRLVAVLGLVIVVIFYFAAAVVPPLKAGITFGRGRDCANLQDLQQCLQKAIDADPLSPEVARTAARMMMRAATTEDPLDADASVPEKALEFATAAWQRNPASFKTWRLRSDIFLLLSQRTKGEQSRDYLQKAYEAMAGARDRYPGSDEIHYGLGMIAEEMGDYENALTHFQKAIEIELAYQTQFRVMYPEREPVVSRLGNTAFTIAKAKVAELQAKLGEKDQNEPRMDTDGHE